MSKYLEIKNTNQERFNEFSKNYIFWIFAFSEKEFNDKLKEHDLTKDNIISIGAGGFIKKDHKTLYLEEMHRLNNDDAFKQVKNDDAEALQAFIYELANHEFCITYDLEDALEALGTTEEEIRKDPRLTKILKEAINEYLKNSDNL